MSKLSDREISMSVEKVLENLDPSTEPESAIRPYADLISTKNLKGTSFAHRVVRKFTRPMLGLYKKYFKDYLDQQTRVDKYVFEEIGTTNKRVDELFIKFDEKIFETHKLLDNFKKEILFELVDLKGGGASTNDLKQIKQRVINADKVAKLKKVNIGSGFDIREDYINIDHRALEGVDVVADVKDLPFKPQSLDEIFASHVAEHFIERDFKEILKYWFTLIAPKGQIRIIVPNIELMAKRYTSGELTWEQLRGVALGGQDYASDYHFNHFSVASMKELVTSTLPEAKFEVADPGRRNGDCYEMEILIKR